MCSFTACFLMAGGDWSSSAVVWLVVILIVVPIAVIAGHEQKKKLNKAYTRLARLYGGACVPGGFWGHPTVYFRHDGTDALVNIYSTGGKYPTYYTQVHFTMPPGRLPFRCEVYPEAIMANFQKFFGMQDIEIGSPDFDRSYIIKSDDVEQVLQFLGEPARRQINRLRDFLGNSDVYISLKGGSLLVKKLSLIRQYEQLRGYTEMAIELYDRVASPIGVADSDGIQFVEEPAEPESGKPVCQVCGEEITADEVLCRACKTPHHRDCWEYAGTCSTYGCRETRCVAPKPSRPGRPVRRPRHKKARM